MIPEDRGSPRHPAALLADLLLAITLVAVPLAFTTSVREFLSFKSQLLALGVGAATVFAVFDPRARLDGIGAWLPLGSAAWVVIVAMATPSADGLTQGAHLAAVLLLVWLARVRISTWPPLALAACVAGPLLVDLLWSLTQGLGVGVLPATASSFGGIHGLLVGTVGNPNENAWYLLLALVLGAGAIGRHLRAGDRDTETTTRLFMVGWVLTAAGVVGVIVANRSRAALVGVIVAAALALGLRMENRRRLLLPIAAAAAVVVAVVGAWGGAAALRGRAYLAGIGIDLLADQLGLPAGTGAFARYFPDAQAAALLRAPDLLPFHSRIEHAHLDVVELTYELGLPGGLLLGALVGLALREAWQRRRSPLAASIGVTLATGAVLGTVGYVLFSPAAAAILAVAAGLASSSDGARQDANREAATPARPCRRRAILGAALAMGLALPMVAAPSLVGELRLTRALKAWEAGDPSRALALGRLADATWPDADAAFYLGNLELETGSAEAAIVAYRRSFAALPRAETAANLALALRAMGQVTEAVAWEAEARRLDPGWSAGG